MFSNYFESISDKEIEEEYNELLEEEWDYYDEMWFNDMISENKISD